MSAERERWERVAVRRFELAGDALRKLTACANRQSYQFEPAEAHAMIDRLQEQLDELRDAFLGEPDDEDARSSPAPPAITAVDALAALAARARAEPCWHRSGLAAFVAELPVPMLPPLMRAGLDRLCDEQETRDDG